MEIVLRHSVRGVVPLSRACWLSAGEFCLRRWLRTPLDTQAMGEPVHSAHDGWDCTILTCRVKSKIIYAARRAGKEETLPW